MNITEAQNKIKSLTLYINDEDRNGWFVSDFKTVSAAQKHLTEFVEHIVNENRIMRSRLFTPRFEIVKTTHDGCICCQHVDEKGAYKIIFSLGFIQPFFDWLLKKHSDRNKHDHRSAT